jgi:type I restriction enzyme R subunit
LYHIKREIYEFHLYTNEDVDRFCEIFYDPKRDEGNLHPILDSVVDKFCSIEDEETQEDYRSKIQSYIRMYGYLSQIINFTDIELEKTFVFLKYLNKKLPKRQIDRFDISDTIDLDSLRIQKVHEKVEGLNPTTTVVEPPTFGGGTTPEPEYDFLSEIINQVNNLYGVNLTDEDRLDLSRLSQKLIEDPEVGKYMNGNNTEDNKRNFFKQQFEGKMIDYVNERFEFYKKVDENPSMKNLIFQIMYKNFRDHQTAEK